MIGLGAGLGGVGLVLLLRFIQHLAYGYSPDLLISSQSFLEGVRGASPLRRVVVLMICGLFAGCGWWVVYRYSKPIVSIDDAVKSNKPNMPFVSTLANALLQIITIALGSPLGRELAPREIAASFAIWLSSKARLTTNETHIMLACAAGAGLAAVYNVPLGGVFFTLEVILKTFRWRAVLPAILTSVIATGLSWLALGNDIQYHLPDIEINTVLVVWSVFMGPIFGFMAYWFGRTITNARIKALHNEWLPVLCFLNFTFIGILAIYFPELLGNGKAVVQIGFSSAIGVDIAAILLLLRWIITWSSLRVGAQGGVLTPSLANGALLAVIMGDFWGLIWPGVSQEAYIVIGATAFLAAAQKMPLTAIVLIFEFTGIHFDLMLPLLFAVVGSISVCSLCRQKFG